jgi:hypothetical protein
MNFENRGGGVSVSSSKAPPFRHSSWSAGIQADMDVSGRIPHTWMPAIHAGMTGSPFSCSVGERKLMKHSFGIAGLGLPVERTFFL